MKVERYSRKEAKKKLEEVCLEAFNEDEDADSDIEHFVFEAAMEYVYGSDVWALMRQRRAQEAITEKKAELERMKANLEAELKRIEERSRELG
jgi:hypothetical protein